MEVTVGPVVAFGSKHLLMKLRNIPLRRKRKSGLRPASCRRQHGCKAPDTCLQSCATKSRQDAPCWTFDTVLPPGPLNSRDGPRRRNPDLRARAHQRFVLGTGTCPCGCQKKHATCGSWQVVGTSLRAVSFVADCKQLHLNSTIFDTSDAKHDEELKCTEEPHETSEVTSSFTLKRQTDD